MAARWWEEYRCGCVSDAVPRKRDLSGYCPTHGESSRGPQRETPRRVRRAFSQDARATHAEIAADRAEP